MCVCKMYIVYVHLSMYMRVCDYMYTTTCNMYVYFLINLPPKTKEQQNTNKITKVIH